MDDREALCEAWAELKAALGRLRDAVTGQLAAIVTLPMNPARLIRSGRQEDRS